MKKSELLVKYKHHLTLRNFSESTIRAYVNGLHLFLNFLHENKIEKVFPEDLSRFFFECKNAHDYSYSSLKQLLASVKFLYHEVLKEPIDFDFNIKMKKPSTIPEVLSVEEVQRFLNTFTNLKHKPFYPRSVALLRNALQRLCLTEPDTELPHTKKARCSRAFAKI